jgi:hypothetical protein
MEPCRAGGVEQRLESGDAGGTGPTGDCGRCAR